ncbi:MAG: hypothetical protein ACLTMP_10690 [Eggerthella lenta]
MGDKARALADYRTDDLVALVKAFVLPYTVGVFVANAVVAYRRAKAKHESDAILDGFAQSGAADEETLPELEKRYLFFGGRRALWDIALRSIGHDVCHPFAPRKLTWKERLTGSWRNETLARPIASLLTRGGMHLARPSADSRWIRPVRADRTPLPRWKKRKPPDVRVSRTKAEATCPASSVLDEGGRPRYRRRSSPEAVAASLAHGVLFGHLVGSVRVLRPLQVGAFFEHLR